MRAVSESEMDYIPLAALKSGWRSCLPQRVALRVLAVYPLKIDIFDNHEGDRLIPVWHPCLWINHHSQFALGTLRSNWKLNCNALWCE